MIIQNRLTQGDSWSCVYTPPKVIEPTITSLKLALRGATNTDIVGAYDQLAGIYTLSVSPAVAQYLPGNYTYCLYLEAPGMRMTVEIGELVVLADPTGAYPVNVKTHNQRMLESITAYIEKRATNGQIDHIKSLVDNKELWRITPMELLNLKQRYESLVARESGRFPKSYDYTFKG